MASLGFAFPIAVIASLFLIQLQAFPASGFWPGYSGLFPEFYDFTCPQANEIVMSVLEKAIAEDPRMAASLLRLHFHDCFVQVYPLNPIMSCFLCVHYYNWFSFLLSGL